MDRNLGFAFIYVVLCSILLVACDGATSGRRENIYTQMNRSLSESTDSVGARAMLSKVDSLKQKGINDFELADLSFQVASFLFQNHDDNALVSYIDAISPDLVALDANRDSLDIRAVDLELMVNTVYLDLGVYDRALQGLKIALKTAEQLNLTDRVAVIYNNMSSVAMATGKLDEGIELQKKSLELSKQLNDREGIIYSYNNLASAYKDSGDNDKVLEYRMLALHLLDQPDDSLVKAMVMRNLSGDYFRMGEISMAIKLLEPALDYFERHDLVTELPLTRARYAALLAQTGRVEEAERLFRGAVDDSRRQSGPVQESIVNEYANFCKNRGMLGEVYELLEQRYIETDSVNTAGRERKNVAVAQLYERELMKSQNIAGQLREANTRIRISVYIILAILLIACAVFGYFIVMERRSSRHISRLQRAADERWSGAAIHLEHLTGFVKALVPQLQEVQSLLAGRNSRKANDEVRRITASVMQEVNVRQQENPLAMVDTDFKNKLLTRFPELTTRDLRLCMLLMKGYSSKEIAHLSCCEVRSVDTARNRLRKKLGIPPATDLSKFFLSLASE